MKNTKGITLIALIITIIVMLILVAVTVNYEINTGLVAKGKKAVADYEKKQDYERLIACVENDLNEIDLDKTVSKIKKEFGENKVQIVSQTEKYVIIKVINKKNIELKYIINKDNKIEEYENLPKWTISQDGKDIIRKNADGTETILTIGKYISYDEENGKVFDCSNYEGIYGFTDSTNYKDENTKYTVNGSDTTTAAGNLKWLVYDVDDQGRIMLISTLHTNTYSYKISGNTYSPGTLGIINTEIGYLNAKRAIDDFCNNLYGNGKGAAYARSWNIDDVNNLTGYVQEKIEKKYGSYWKFRGNGSKIQYNVSNLENGFDESNWKDTTKTYLKLAGESEIIYPSTTKETKVILYDGQEDYSINTYNKYKDTFANGTFNSNFICPNIEEKPVATKSEQWINSYTTTCYESGSVRI